MVVAAVALLLLGFVLHPFRKARRRRAQAPESATVDSPGLGPAAAVPELSLETGGGTGEPDTSEQLVTHTAAAQ